MRAETYEKEKEFYYQKLRDIELLCQTPVIQDIEVGTAHAQVLSAGTQCACRDRELEASSHKPSANQACSIDSTLSMGSSVMYPALPASHWWPCP
jgi:hypothetical protein